MSTGTVSSTNGYFINIHLYPGTPNDEGFFQVYCIYETSEMFYRTYDLPKHGGWTDWQIINSSNHGSTYTKMSDGTLICWGRQSYVVTSADWSAFGSWYYTRCNVNVEFPVAFNGAPSVTVTAITPDTPISQVNNSSSKINYIDFVRPNAIGTTVEYCWQAIGRWK